MTLSNKSLTMVVVATGICGLGFAVFDSPNISNDRSEMRSLDLGKSERRTRLNVIKIEDDDIQNNVDNLNQEIIVLRQDQQKIFEKMDDLIGEIKRLDEQQSYSSSVQENRLSSDEKVYASEKEINEMNQIRNESYQTNLIGQEVDSVWSELAHEKVNSLISKESFIDSSVVSIDCRDTLCQLDVSHGDQSAMENFIEEIPAHMAWNNESFIETVEQADGSVVTKIYFSRDGHSLPSID